MEKKKIIAGDIINLEGIDFVVLDTAYNGVDGDLFLLTVKSQTRSEFGETNNYTESTLRGISEGWLYGFPRKFREAVKPRTISLVTPHGCNGYGSLEVMVAPLTIDEHCKYEEVIPNCDDAYWMSTGYGGPEHFGSAGTLYVYTNGGWSYYCCSYSCGVRPALVISSCLLDNEGKLDLSQISTEDLLDEIRRRMK